jgi:hypothetical protein
MKENKMNDTVFKIVSITQNGEPRTDGRYPLRVGCTGRFALLTEGLSVLFEYLTDAEGNEKSGTLRTSVATEIVHEARHIVVKTLNSVYTFSMI